MQLEKARSVSTMFDAIAGRYDLMNRLMSAGLDGRWRAAAVASLGRPQPGPLLDIGTGTGDLAFEMRRQFPAHPVTGIDLSGAMMGVARHKTAQRAERRYTLAQADTLRLPFADGAFSGAATAFTLRNVADLPAALTEIWRVLRPGARFACLEITRPRGGLMGWLFSLYFQRLVPLVGTVITGNRGAYRYLPESVERFVTGDELAAAMRAAGFERVRMRRFWPGALTLHTASRRSEVGGRKSDVTYTGTER